MIVLSTSESEAPLTGVGGILGVGIGKVTITDCTNKSGVILNEEAQTTVIGGIIGLGFDISDHGIVVSNCVNRGTIIAKSTTNAEMNSAGGIAGTIVSIKLINCYNTGNVSAEGQLRIGGIVGMGMGAIKNSYSTGILTVDLQGLKGGITGGLEMAAPSDLSNCSYLDAPETYSYYDYNTKEPVTVEGMAKTSEQMKDTTYLGELNAWVTANPQVNGVVLKTWKQQAGVNEGYPSFNETSVDTDLTNAKTATEINKQKLTIQQHTQLQHAKH